MRVDVNVSAEIGGRSTIWLPDGRTIDGPVAQSFVKIEKERIAGGDWLLNPGTNETHKVLGVTEHEVELSTSDGSVKVPWDEVPEVLLLVINE